MKRSIKIFISVCMFIIAIQCGKPGASDTKPEGEKNTQNQEAKGTENKKDTASESVPVQVITPTIGDISSFLLFSSNIDSEEVVDIYPMTSGLIEKINFDEGQHVKKGDILAVLDDREATINEKKANIHFKNLTVEFERQKELFQREMLSGEDFGRFKYNLDTSKLNWVQAQLLLSYTRITTPIAGVVSKRYIKTGNRINTTQMAFSVVQDKEKIAVVNIPEQEKNALFLKQDAVIYSGTTTVRGYVKRISPAIDPASGTFKVTVDVNDKENSFAVGQFVNVKIIKKVHQNVILLAKDALIYDGGKVFIFIITKANEAEKKEIKLGFEDGNIVEVIEGLTKNEQVVSAGKSSLKHKTLVRIISPVV